MKLETGVQFGKGGLPDWRKHEGKDIDPDDEEMEKTPGDVVAVLGFDPKIFSSKSKKASEKAEKCRVIYPPEPFDFKQPPEPPVIFEAGAIDQGKARDWQKELIEFLSDVPCVVLNPRRKDWDSSWEQSIDNPQFREQVEWELKGLEQASFVAMCLPKDSKAPISLLELGLHVIGKRMIVCCEEGYYRKGNVDIVCARYGVPVFESFEDFKREVKRQLISVDNRKQASDRLLMSSDKMAWRIMAKEFIMRMRGDAGIRVASLMRHCSFYKAVNGKWYMELADREYGERKDATTYGPFTDKEAVLKFLDDFSNPGGYWEDEKGTKPVPTRSPNGDPVQRPTPRSRIWFSSDFGSPLRRRPDYGERSGDIGERMKSMKTRNVTAITKFPLNTTVEVDADEHERHGDVGKIVRYDGTGIGGVNVPSYLVKFDDGESDVFGHKELRKASDNMRVRVISNRIVASAKQFMGAEQWDGEILGQHMRFQWSDRSESHYRLTEMPVPGKKRLRVRSGGFAPWLRVSQKREYGFLNIVNVSTHIHPSMTYDQAAAEIDKQINVLAEEANSKAEEKRPLRELVSGPWETLVFYLEVEPPDTNPMVVKGKDFEMRVTWNNFKSYSPSSDFQQADPHYTMYESKSPTSARKLYKMLRGNPDLLRTVSWTVLGDWLKRNGIRYDIHFSSWH